MNTATKQKHDIVRTKPVNVGPQIIQATSAAAYTSKEKTEGRKTSVHSFCADSKSMSSSRTWWQFSLSLFVAIVLLGVSTVGSTVSFYNDIERSEQNVIATGGVDFILEHTPFIGTTTDTWSVDITPEEFSNPFYYHASSTAFSGSEALCAALNVTATLDEEVMYEGLLKELYTASTTVLDTWQFSFSGMEAFVGETCNFAIEYNGWQTRHGYNEGGYNDTERVEYSITVPSLLISKIYFDYDVDETCRSATGSTSAQLSSGDLQIQVVNNELPLCSEVSEAQEWVELYNRTEDDIDLAGWQICDAAVCDYLSTTTVSSGGFALIATKPTIHTEISIPWGIPLILVEDELIGNGLRTLGDSLHLVDSLGATVDSLNWGDTESPWAADSLTASSGRLLARLPYDVDTNTADDWQQLGLPTAAVISPSGATAFVAAGDTITIEWEANNLNGADEELHIDLYYYGSDNQIHLIELNVPNDGFYEFIVPANIAGEIRFKLVATGPENPLLNTRFVSGLVDVAASAVVEFVCETCRAATGASSLSTLLPATSTATTAFALISGTTTETSTASTTSTDNDIESESENKATSTASTTVLVAAYEIVEAEAVGTTTDTELVDVAGSAMFEEFATDDAPEENAEIEKEEREQAAETEKETVDAIEEYEEIIEEEAVRVKKSTKTKVQVAEPEIESPVETEIETQMVSEDGEVD